MRRLLLFPLLVAGCLTPAAGDAPPAAARHLDEPLPPVVYDEPADWTYDPIGKRDPFRSWVSLLPDDGGGGDDHLLTPLQRFDLDQLCVTGVAMGEQPLALVATPDGEGHPVRVGGHMGRNWGRVESIRDTEVLVVEEYRDPIEGSLLRNEVPLALGACSPDAEMPY